MSNENVLTHEAFARAPVEKGRRPGRYPKSVARLDDVRRSRRKIRQVESKQHELYRQRKAQLERFIGIALDIADEVGGLARLVGTGTDYATYIALDQALQQAADISEVLAKPEAHHE